MKLRRFGFVVLTLAALMLSVVRTLSIVTPPPQSIVTPPPQSIVTPPPQAS